MQQFKHTTQLKYLLGFSSIATLYGVTGLVVWFAGQYLGWRLSSRVVMIALILLTVPFTLLAGFLYSRRSAKKEEQKKAGDAAKADGTEAPDKAVKPVGSNEDVAKGAEEVVSFLKSSDLASTGNALYALPWYLVTGSRGSGKTALVLGSGLNFQALPSQRQAEMKYVTPTRQVDWRVTSDAVFIDTPGRLQAEGTDFDEWSSLLETIKKQRSNRPLDGLVLTVNTEKILQSDEREIEEQAKILRARLDDATKRLKSRFPVYLVFTHADVIEGFRDSFSTSKKEGENLVWGATIPLEKSDNAQSLFDSEFELLQDSLMKRRLIRLSAPFSPLRQLRIFNFPLHFSSTRRKLGTFVTTLFRPNPFSESPFLRGFYFSAVPVNRDNKGGGKALPQTVGSTYFTNKLFSDVILRDKDLVKTFQDQRRRPPVFGWLLTLLGTFITVFVLALSGYSLYINNKFTDDAVKKATAVIKTNKTDANIDPLTKETDAAQAEINEINSLRSILVQMDEYEREGAPFYMRFGLYSGNRLLRERLMYIYYVAVERRFREPTIRRLERELNNFAAGNATPAPAADDGRTRTPQEIEEENLERHYDLLEAYLLLTEEHKAHAKDKSASLKLERALEKYWLEESKLPPGNETLAREQLRFYFKQVDRESEYTGDTSGFPRISPNAGIVKNVRARLVRYPAYKRYLNRQITEVTNEVGEVGIETLLGGNSRGLLEGTVKIPGAYTILGYRSYMKARIAGATEVLSQDDWVMGEEGKAEAIKTDELQKLKSEYFNKFAANWQRLIGGARVPAYKSDDEMKEALETFSGTESPIKLFLREVVKNTNLAAAPEAKSWFDLSWISDLWNSTGGSGEVEDNTELDKQFNQLFLFMGDPSSKDAQPIDQYANSLSDVSKRLNSASAAEMRDFKVQLSNEDSSPRSFHKTLTAVEQKVNGLTKGFETSATREVARLLQMPLQNVRIKFGADSTTQIERTWSDNVLKDAKAIETGYPFASGGTPTDLKTVSTFLNPQNGTLTAFYNTRLKNFFDGEPGSELTVKAESPVKFSEGFVAYLNNAFKLQKALFGTGATPGFEYDFIIQKEGDTIIEGTIDGTPVSSRETGSFKLKFPAQSGINGVSLNILSTGATVSTDQQNTSSPTNLNFPGEWGLFNFFDAASSKSKTESGYDLTYSRGGKTVKIQVRPIGGDPFDRSLFTSVRAPEKILQ